MSHRDDEQDDDARPDHAGAGNGLSETLHAGARESPLAAFHQRVPGQRNQFELFVDRVSLHTRDMLGSRRVTLPLDTLSPHVVVRQRGPLPALVGGTIGAVAAPFLPGGGLWCSLVLLIVGGATWFAGRRQYIVFPGQIADLELFRDLPDAASARRFVAQVVRRIESLQQELRALERQKLGDEAFDRVDELLAFRDLYAEGIIDRAELRMAAEALARKGPGRIGFR